MNRIPQSDKDKLTLTDAANVFGVSKRAIQNAIRDGRLVPVRCGLCRRAYGVTRARVNAILTGGAA